MKKQQQQSISQSSNSNQQSSTNSSELGVSSMQRTSCWGMSLPCLSRRLVWRCGCFQLLYSGFTHFVFEKKKEEEITAGSLYPWTIPIATTMATCARNCSYSRRQRMYSSTGSIPFAVSQIIIQRKAIGVIKLLTLPWH